MEKDKNKSCSKINGSDSAFLLALGSFDRYMGKKEETNDIVQYLIPALESVGISISMCKIDVTTEKSGNKRGDIYISTKPQTDRDFEANIIGLIEAKHRNSNIGDMDWRDAMRQGKEKAQKQKLNFYCVTNCKTEFRFYNAYNDEEIIIDGRTPTRLVPLDVLNRIQTQVSAKTSYVKYKIKSVFSQVSESEFRSSLSNLANIYRSAGLKKGDERIDPTVSFVVLKYISDKEADDRTLNKTIKLWSDLKKIAFV